MSWPAATCPASTRTARSSTTSPWPAGAAATATRVPEVIDAWYDSGAMPFAQFGYPHRNKELFERSYPAQFICEAIDQTRGWFYTLMAVGTLVFDKSAYENVVCLGHIVAEDGRKMSKHLGNILEPIPLLEQHGADAVRWYMAAAGSPWSARRVGHTTLQEVVRKTLLTYWNTVAFQALYGRTANWSPSAADPAPADRPVLDRWVLSELNLLVRDVDAALAKFDTQEAGKLLSAFVADLSNWYVRRSRRRFWRGDPAALATLHEALRTVTLLLAPITPFITERVWQDLVVAVDPAAAPSVHLAAYPEPDDSLIAPSLGEQMGLVRRLVEVGRTARAESGVKTRQPLARSLASAHGFAALEPELIAEIAAELNVAVVLPVSASEESLVDTTAKANFRPLGKRFGKGVQDVAKAIAAADAAVLKQQLAAGTATCHGRRRSGGAHPGRGDHHRDAARGLGGRLGRRGDPGAGSAPDAGAAPGRAGPRRHPAHPGGPQDQRPGGLRPHRAALPGRRRADGGGAGGAPRSGRRRGAGHELRPGRADRRRNRS